MGKKIFGVLAMMGLAFLAAGNYIIFVFPNHFAPSGVDGICTMVQDIFQINMGYLALLCNLPLIVAAFLVLNRDFAVKSTVFVITFSVSVIALKAVDLSWLLYSTASGTSIALAPVAAGTIRGLLYVATLSLNGSAGGIDIISALIKHKKPHLDLMNIIFGLNILIAFCSYFVYGMSLEPVICSILYAFVTSSVCSKLRLSKHETVKFEIITQTPQQLCNHITHTLHQKATILSAKGAYSGNDTKVVMCVVKKESAPYVEQLLMTYPSCTVFKSIVHDSLLGVTYK